MLLSQNGNPLWLRLCVLSDNMLLKMAVCLVAAATVVIRIAAFVAAAAVIAEYQQEQDYEPKNCVVSVEKTPSVVAASTE